MASHPTVGVEEEFLLVDPDTGEPVARNEAVARHAAARGVKLQLELTSCQIETTTDVMSTSEELRAELTRLRRIAAEAAEANGARLLAVGLPPTVPHEFPITDTPRYREIAEKFGMLAHEQGICGCHVHVAVPSREAAIRVSNRLRPWLPLLLALTANSAIYRNTDTGYASWRSVLWQRWPSAGPPPHFDSSDEYDAVVRDASATPAPCSTTAWSIGMSARRPSSRRSRCVSQTCPATVAETVLLATLIRASVMTALEDERRGDGWRRWRRTHCGRRTGSRPATVWTARRSTWSKSHASVPGAGLFGGLVDHVRPALEALGDYDIARAELARIAERGQRCDAATSGVAAPA